MLKKFLATASVAGLLAGAASALEVVPNVTGSPAGAPAILAAELDYAGGNVATVTDDELQFVFYPTGGTFPTGNVVLRVEVTGAEFTAALDGSEVTTVSGTSVISSGGSAGGSTVNFLLSDVSTCTSGTPCVVDLPLELTGGNVTVSAGLQTDAGVPIDNTSLTTLETATLALVVPAFSAVIDPSITTTQATLASLFTALTVDGILGDITVAPTQVDVDPTAGVNLVTVKSALDGTPVGVGDVDSIDVLVEGTMDAYDPASAPAGNFVIGAGPTTVDAAADTAEASIGLGVLSTVTATPDGVTAIERSDYSASIVVSVTAGSDLTSGATFSGDLQPISREGTEVTFPWTQTATQGEASGATSVFRIGNLGASDTGAVFAEVRNASEAGFTNPGIVQLAPSIDGNGEFVINSAGLEAAVGNYGRGDVNFIVEANDTTLTGRQFVVRNGVIQQVIGGTVFQDQN
jgi:hypothetical protein